MDTLTEIEKDLHLVPDWVLQKVVELDYSVVVWTVNGMEGK